MAWTPNPPPRGPVPMPCDPECPPAWTHFPMTGRPNPAAFMIGPIPFQPDMSRAGRNADDLFSWRGRFCRDDYLARRNRYRTLTNYYRAVAADTAAAQERRKCE